MGSISSLGSVVMMVKLSTFLPSGLRHTSHSPASPKRLPAPEMNPHRHLSLSFFAPFIEAVSRNNRFTRSLKEGRSVSFQLLRLSYDCRWKGLQPNAESTPSA